MLRLIIILGDVITIIGVLCACGAEPSPAMSVKRLTEADTNSSIELRVGDKLELTLPGNPTTGFQWEVGAGDTAILQPSGEPEFEPASSAIGSGGKVTLRFDAVGTGQMELKLVYQRPFEKDAPPEQTFEVTVTVK